MASGSGQIFGFGVFEADLRSGELRKCGLKVKLHCQPFQVRVALLQRPGEVVTRDELQSLLWPAETYVDFDRALNKCANRIRNALGDSAETPRFIETLPKRGYRWIAPTSSSTSQSINRLSQSFVFTHLAVNQMVAQKTGGSVTAISTAMVEHLIAGVNASVPMITKGGLEAITRGLAMEYAKDGVASTRSLRASSIRRCM